MLTHRIQTRLGNRSAFAILAVSTFCFLAKSAFAGLSIWTPDIAMNGNIVPIIVKFTPSLQPGESVQVVVDDATAIRIDLTNGGINEFSTRIKMKASGDIVAKRIVGGEATESSQHHTKVTGPVATIVESVSTIGHQPFKEEKTFGLFKGMYPTENGFVNTLNLNDNNFDATIRGSNHLSANNFFITVKGTVGSGTQSSFSSMDAAQSRTQSPREYLSQNSDEQSRPSGVKLDCGLDLPSDFRFLDTSKPDFGVPGATVKTTEQKYRMERRASGGQNLFYNQDVIQTLVIDRSRGEFIYGELKADNPSLQVRNSGREGTCQIKTAPRF